MSPDQITAGVTLVSILLILLLILEGIKTKIAKSRLAQITKKRPELDAKLHEIWLIASRGKQFWQQDKNFNRLKKVLLGVMKYGRAVNLDEPKYVGIKTTSQIILTGVEYTCVVQCGEIQLQSSLSPRTWVSIVISNQKSSKEILL